MCLALKIIRYKLYSNLEFLPIFTHEWKDLLIDFVTSLTILANWKGDSYNFILFIINQLIKMVYYKPVKIIIDILDLAEAIINIVI